MYEEFYQLQTDPFRLSPDSSFCFEHPSYTKARNHLLYGLMRDEGLVVVTGEPGTGKTTLIQDLLSDIGEENIAVAKLTSTQIGPHDLLRMVAFHFGINAEGLDKASVLMRLEEYFTKEYQRNRRALIMVDEAQDLSIESLEELRLLTNYRDSQPLVQIFLLGQEQLREKIRGPHMEQLRQRIVAASHFLPLDRDETRAYIEHRLKVSGWQNDPQISQATFVLVHHYSRGIPRRINLICSRLLLHGAVEEKHLLKAEDVRGVIEEMPGEMLDPTAEPDITELLKQEHQQAVQPVREHVRLRASGRPSAVSFESDDLVEPDGATRVMPEIKSSSASGPASTVKPSDAARRRPAAQSSSARPSSTDRPAESDSARVRRLPSHRKSKQGLGIEGEPKKADELLGFESVSDTGQSGAQLEQADLSPFLVGTPERRDDSTITLDQVSDLGGSFYARRDAVPSRLTTERSRSAGWIALLMVLVVVGYVVAEWLTPAPLVSELTDWFNTQQQSAIEKPVEGGLDSSLP